MSEDLQNEIVIYKTNDGKIQLETKIQEDSVWLTQDMMSKLFDTTIQNINMHIKNVYKEGELDENRTIKDFLIVRNEGHRTGSK